MVQQVTPNYADASILAPIKKNAATAAATNGGTATGGATNSSGASDIGSTFLNLLVEELKNQDPTNPVDSTAMVGQMISLNQLDQLVSIDQIVGGNAGALTGSSSTTASATGQAITTQGTAKSTAHPAASPAPLPFDPGPVPTQTLTAS